MKLENRSLIAITLFFKSPLVSRIKPNMLTIVSLTDNHSPTHPAP